MSFVHNDRYICLYDHIYTLTSYQHSYGCKLTCNTPVRSHKVPPLLCNSPLPLFVSHLPLRCPHSLPLLLSHSFFPFLHVVATAVVVPDIFLSLSCCCCCECLPVALFISILVLTLFSVTPLYSMYVFTLYLCVSLVYVYIYIYIYIYIYVPMLKN